MARINIESMLDPQMKAAMKKQAELTETPEGGNPEPDPQEMRRQYRIERSYWNADAPAVASITEHDVDTKNGAVPIRIYHPEPGTPLPVLVYSHGGGFVVGDNDTHDKIMRLLSLRSHMAVVGVAYHLSPESKFPVAIEDIEAVIMYLLEKRHSFSVDTGHLGLGGDSAGAYLSMGVYLKLRAIYPGLVKHLQLIYGSYGLKDSITRRLYGGPEDGCGPADLAYYNRCFFGSKENMRHPLADPLNSDLNGFPPTFILAAELDPLHDDSIVLYRLMKDAGVDAELKIYKGVLHGFIHLSRMVDKAEQALSDCASYMRKWMS